MEHNAKEAQTLKGLLLSQRVIPIPQSISPEAQAALARERTAQPTPPALNDKAAWRVHIDRVNSMWAPLLRDRAAAFNVRTETRTIAGVPVFVVEPSFIPKENQDKALLYLHGGGLV